MTSSLYVDQTSPVHRLNPVTKLVALLCLIVIVFAIPHWSASALAVLLVIVPVAVISRCGGRLAKYSAALLLPILIVLVLVQGLTFPGGQTPVWQWSFMTVTAEGLLFALTIGARITALVLASILLVLTTHPGDLMSALTQRGMSPKFSYIISSTLQLIPSFQDRANAILLAQQARGLALPRNPLRRAGALLPLLGPLVLGMFTDVDERSTAMEARGFGSTARRTLLIPVPDSAPQRVARWVMPVLAAAAIVVPIVGGLL
ncbi:MAG: energy-coupling factor transporter transmembrane component T [Propionicimonas sp.]|uniref:energy-coupling factor transporter transmembrane component T family protein n=1 Tax=Propionicimonas sp. TaxID=1955623 RepID=UPI002B216E77|nr:energy-coupling factor transporter transmembrane component T [Propionicimonas sp.]MEA4944384.1 energy-coupling factor transporter transmembrane component T [Propionicimonas sp.]MEA5053430.1 energy-coupling factor transporter transmembrane component T [Propionicimonas sp.]MEA5116429.1 energy-coupling factor transporter transmembrane component T [Propionicimonas sp.]